MVDWNDEQEPPPTEEELVESERLRRELEVKDSKHPDVELARALHHAVDPRPLDALTHRRILDRAVPKHSYRWYQRTEVYIAFAAAAAVLIAFFSLRTQSAPSSSAALVQVHSTQALFKDAFPKEGDTSKRMDAIVASRTRDLRSNRYARWGVK
jgi:hypothetical protein